MKLRRIQNTGTIDFYSASTNSVIELPFADIGVSAGFPSPAQDFLDMSIDLNQELIKNPSATVFFG